jgi:protein-tyrosine phosphatase
VHGGRVITWEGFFNARDLGGLPTRDGLTTRRGAFIRSADLRFVSAAGWRAARAAGVRTIVDLRNPDEIRPHDGAGLTVLAGSAQFVAPADGLAVPSGMQRVEAALDDISDTAFWQQLNGDGLNGTPLYYQPFLAHKAERCAAVITALARAQLGGVLFHCGAGRDRTGLVALLLLALVNTEPAAIVDDYELTKLGLPPLYAALDRPDDQNAIEQALAARSTTTRDALLATLDGFDAKSYLLAAGVLPGDLASIRRRLIYSGLANRLRRAMGFRPYGLRPCMVRAAGSCPPSRVLVVIS